MGESIKDIIAQIKQGNTQTSSEVKKKPVENSKIDEDEDLIAETEKEEAEEKKKALSDEERALMETNEQIQMLFNEGIFRRELLAVLQSINTHLETIASICK